MAKLNRNPGNTGIVLATMWKKREREKRRGSVIHA